MEKLPPPSIDFLQAYAGAWNQHDANTIMSLMTEDCVFEASAGPAVCGTHFEGSAAVRSAFEAVWEAYPDAQWVCPQHFVVGDRGVSEWTFMGTGLDGSSVQVRGCDLFTFRDGKIALKNSYRKHRPAG